jgi:hypothetical protein
MLKSSAWTCRPGGLEDLGAIEILGLRFADPGSLEDKVMNKHGAWQGSDLMQGVNCAGRPMAWRWRCRAGHDSEGTAPAQGGAGRAL